MQREHFISSILDDPDSDDPRLVFADWLDEQGDPQGELIRTQCQVENLKVGVSVELFRRQRELITQNASNWLLPFRQFSIAPARLFSRGLLRFWNATSNELVAKSNSKKLDQIFRNFGLSHLAVRDGNKKNVLLDCELLNWVNELTLKSSNLSDPEAEKFAALTHLSRLRCLRIFEFKFGQVGLAAISESPHLSKLERLELSHVDDPYWMASSVSSTDLASVLRLPNLTELSMRALPQFSMQQFLSDAGENLGKLKVLKIHARCLVGEASFDTEFLRNLEVLSIETREQVASRTIAGLADPDRFPSLLKVRFGKQVGVPSRMLESLREHCHVAVI